jgi:DNA-directed RNA polymerase specialized sigma24 family protein
MNPPPPTPAGPVAPRSTFPTTRWSIVVNAGASSDSRARPALETLCRQYWYPLYSFVRRQGRPHHEAEDCTQEFLARLLADDGMARARPERGRFRTFLLAALRHFLTDEWRRAQAEKRGGGAALLPLELQDAEGRFLCEPVDPRLTPEQAFDRNWALSMLDRAMIRLRADYEGDGRGELFAALSPLMWGTTTEETSAKAAERLAMTGHAFTMALHRLRRRFRERLRDEVADTVAEGADVDAELHYLIAAVGSNPSPT